MRLESALILFYSLLECGFQGRKEDGRIILEDGLEILLFSGEPEEVEIFFSMLNLYQKGARPPFKRNKKYSAARRCAIIWDFYSQQEEQRAA